MSLRFLGCGIGRWLKIIDAGVLELADEADSKSVGLITRAGSTPATGTTPRRLANPWYDWVCGLFFMFCVLIYCPSYIIRFAIYGLILGGTLEGHKASCGGIYAQNRIGRWNSSACKCLRWSKYHCAPTIPEFLLGWHRLHTTDLRSYAFTV